MQQVTQLSAVVVMATEENEDLAVSTQVEYSFVHSKPYTKFNICFILSVLSNGFCITLSTFLRDIGPIYIDKIHSNFYSNII